MLKIFASILNAFMEEQIFRGPYSTVVKVLPTPLTFLTLPPSLLEICISCTGLSVSGTCQGSFCCVDFALLLPLPEYLPPGICMLCFLTFFRSLLSCHLHSEAFPDLSNHFIGLSYLELQPCQPHAFSFFLSDFSP